MPLSKNNDTNNFYPVEIPETEWHCDYPFSTHRGCWHDCNYCSSKKYNIRFGGDPCKIRRLKGEWRGDNLKHRIFGNSGIFISPYNDIMTVPDGDIKQILGVCNANADTQFIFQTKRVEGYFNYLDIIPDGSWLGTTIETDDVVMYNELKISKAPNTPNRIHNLVRLKEKHRKQYRFFVTIEPIMQFSPRLLFWMNELEPDLIFIGANTSKVKLNEPSDTSVINLIYSLYDIIGVEKVYLKKNIRRLIPAFYDGWKLAKFGR